MSYMLSEKQLNILSFNRLVKSLNSLQTKDFIAKIKDKFKVVKKSTAYSPKIKNEFSMYLENQWYSLTLKNQKNKCTNSLDPSILSKYILKPLLNIVDERTDKNISFSEGNISLLKLMKKLMKEYIKLHLF